MQQPLKQAPPRAEGPATPHSLQLLSHCCYFPIHGNLKAVSLKQQGPLQLVCTAPYSPQGNHKIVPPEQAANYFAGSEAGEASLRGGFYGSEDLFPLTPYQRYPERWVVGALGLGHLLVKTQKNCYSVLRSASTPAWPEVLQSTRPHPPTHPPQTSHPTTTNPTPACRYIYLGQPYALGATLDDCPYSLDITI